MYKLLIHYAFGLALVFLFTIACSPPVREQAGDLNPSAEGFNVDESDSFAIDIADSVMVAMGGRHNWDQTRYIKWNFFGSRRHVWDRYSGDVIIEGLRDTFLARMNLNNLEGTVNMNGVELTKADSLEKYLQKAKEMWINDSYWLLFPFKLKDSGVTLKYLRMDTTAFGKPAHVLQLTFDDVGVTPQNKYYAYVDTSTNLVTQWDFFSSYEDSIPGFKIPWTNYEQYGKVLLSSDRGEKYKITEISASDTLSQYFK